MGQLKNGKERWGDDLVNRAVYDPGSRRDNQEAEAIVRNKLAKNRVWRVCKSSTDEENKKFIYEIVVNQTSTEVKEVSFEEACKDFGWKSFEIINNGQTIKYVPKTRG